MKLFTLLLLLASLNSVQAQPLNDKEQETLVTFTSSLVDYEILNDNLVALTKKNNEYFIYFTDSKGAKLYETIGIFFPTDLEIDCMGNLFVVGLDSAIQVRITDYVSLVQSLDIATYNSSVRTCEAYFNDNLVRSNGENTLVFEPIEDSVFQENPVVSYIQFSTGVYQSSTPTTLSGQAASNKPSLSDNRPLNLKNDGFTKSWNQKPGNKVSSNYGRTVMIRSKLVAFQRGDSLWVFDHLFSRLLVYSESGQLIDMSRTGATHRLASLEQDRTNGEVYRLNMNSSTCYIRLVHPDGITEEVGSFHKGFMRGHLKIANGYLYYRDAKGKGESIKRVKLNITLT